MWSFRHIAYPLQLLLPIAHYATGTNIILLVICLWGFPREVRVGPVHVTFFHPDSISLGFFRLSHCHFSSNSIIQEPTRDHCQHTTFVQNILFSFPRSFSTATAVPNWPYLRQREENPPPFLSTVTAASISHFLAAQREKIGRNMKIECDVCQSVEASVFCCADEAALCVICDLKVHDANKLASKHPRLSLLNAQAGFPQCDICQEKRAFFFCREDRALLCRDCDFSVHSINDLTAKHTRFLVPGLKVSLHPLPVDTSPSTVSPAGSDNQEKEVGLTKHGNEMNKKLKINPLTDLPVFSPVCSEAGAVTGSGDISQFLTEVEEFLTSSPERLDWFAMENSSKAEDIGKVLAADWAADLGLSLPAEAFYGDSLAEVPNTPSPSQAQMFTYSYSNIMTKPKQKPVFTNFNKGDDTFIVPSITSTKRMRPSWNI